jgi:hypothetical protein
MTWVFGRYRTEWRARIGEAIASHEMRACLVLEMAGLVLTGEWGFSRKFSDETSNVLVVEE